MLFSSISWIPFSYRIICCLKHHHPKIYLWVKVKRRKKNNYSCYQDFCLLSDKHTVLVMMGKKMTMMMMMMMKKKKMMMMIMMNLQVLLSSNKSYISLLASLMYYPFSSENGTSNLMKMEKKNFHTDRKHSGKRRNCSLRAISPFPTVFSKDMYCRHVKTSVCLGKDQERFENCCSDFSISISI